MHFFGSMLQKPLQLFVTLLFAILLVCSLRTLAMAPEKRGLARMKFFEKNMFGSDQAPKSMRTEGTSAAYGVGILGRKCCRKRKSGVCFVSAGGHWNKRIRSVGSIANIMESCEMVGEADDGAELSDDHLIDDDRPVSSSVCGQALYQRSRRGGLVEYHDDGDDTYQCICCDANFWCGESLKRRYTRDPIVYTGCCKKGRVILDPPKQTPELLDGLLNRIKGLFLFSRWPLSLHHLIGTVCLVCD